MPRMILSGPVHSMEVSDQLITWCDGAFVGDRLIVKSLKSRLAGIDQPTIADVETAASALCARRGEAFAGCCCAVCSASSERGVN